MVLKALMAYYSISKMKVQVNEEHSELFTTTEGTKQGGPISPDLFNEYGDELTDWISELEVGIIMGEMKIDIIQYADDITLVADTARGLQTQMDKCKAYGEEYGIQFNPDKTTIVVFNLKVKRTVNEMRADVWQGPFILCGKTVEVANSVKILGQIISNDHQDDEHISKRKKAMHAMIGKLQAMNLNSLHIYPYMKAHLFKTYIRPILTYGIENMELNGNELLEFKKLEGNAMKRLLRIPIRCKTKDLVDSLNIEQTNRYLMRMKLKFVLNKNDYTRSVLEFQTKIKLDNSFVMEIASYLKLSFDFDYDTLINESEAKIDELKQIMKPHENMCNMEMVNKLKRVFNSKNRFTIPDQLFELIKFENKAYIPVDKQKITKKKKNLSFNINIGTVFILLFLIIIFSVIYGLIIDLLK
jgi:hypothetical protein